MVFIKINGKFMAWYSILFVIMLGLLAYENDNIMSCMNTVNNCVWDCVINVRVILMLLVGAGLSTVSLVHWVSLFAKEEEDEN